MRTEIRIVDQDCKARGANYNRSAQAFARCMRDIFLRTSRIDVARFLEGGNFHRADRYCAALVKPEQHRTRERALYRRNRIEQSERQPARPAHKRKIVAEPPDETMRERDSGHPIGATGGEIAFDHSALAQSFARSVDNELSQLPCVAHADVESLP